MIKSLALCALSCLSIYISKLLYLLNLLNSHTACYNHLKAINIDKDFQSIIDKIIKNSNQKNDKKNRNQQLLVVT